MKKRIRWKEVALNASERLYDLCNEIDKCVNRNEPAERKLELLSTYHNSLLRVADKLEKGIWT